MRGIAASRKGDAVAIVTEGQVVVLALPGLAVLARTPVASASEVAWIGETLVIFEPGASEKQDEVRTVVRYFDSQGKLLGGRELMAQGRILGGSGPSILWSAPQLAIVLALQAGELGIGTFASRVTPTAGGDGHGAVIVGVPGALEEWDLGTRTVKRRWRLAAGLLPAATGGTERCVWFSPKQVPNHVEVIPLVNRGQPKQHIFPEAIGKWHAAARADWLVGVAVSGRVAYATDLEGRVTPTKIEFGDGDFEFGLAAGRDTYLIASGKQELVVAKLGIAGNEVVTRQAWSALLAMPLAPPSAAAGTEGIRLDAGLAASGGASATPAAAAANPVATALAAVLASPAGPTSAGPTSPAMQAVANRFAMAAEAATVAMASKTAQPAGRAAMAGGQATSGSPIASGNRDAREQNWRDALLANVTPAGGANHRPIALVLERASVSEHAALGQAVAELYGLYLRGTVGMSRQALAQLVGWPEALGQGLLAARGLCQFDRELVSLSEGTLRFLNER